MRKCVALSRFAAIVVGIGLLGVVQQAPGQTGSHSHPSKSSKSSAKTQSYMVIQIDSEYKVISSSSFNDEKKRLADDYKAKRGAWEDERKVNPDAKPPVQSAIKTIKTGFKTQKWADEYVAKLKEKEKEQGGDSKDSKTPAGNRPTY
jgi:hypothetical protein